MLIIMWESTICQRCEQWQINQPSVVSLSRVMIYLVKALEQGVSKTQLEVKRHEQSHTSMTTPVNKDMDKNMPQTDHLKK